MPILVDTSILLAAADAESESHLAARQLLEETPDALVLPVTVLPEIDYLVTVRLGVRAEVAVLRGLATSAFQLEPLLDADFTRAIELVEQYADSEIGLVDASIVAIAERLRIRRIATLDHRHFAIFRPRHCPAFELLP